MRKQQSTTALVAAAVILTMASGAAGCGDDDESTALSPEVQELVDEYTQTWNDNDGDAFLALVTDDYRFVSLLQEQDADAMAADISADQLFWTISQVDDGIMTGDGPYYGSVVNEFVGPEDDDRITGVSTFVVQDDDGVLKIAEHTYTGQFADR